MIKIIIIEELLKKRKEPNEKSGKPMYSQQLYKPICYNFRQLNGPI